MTETDPFIQRLGRRGDLTPRELDILAGLGRGTRRVAAGQEVIGSGGRQINCLIQTTGVTARFAQTLEGRRQFTQICLPGDLVDLHGFLMKQMDHGILALSDCSFKVVPHAAIRAISESEPNLTRLLWLDTAVDAAIHRQWLLVIGQRDASGRLAHLICELYVRMQASGQAAALRFPMPTNQVNVSDMLGMTAVHVNRTLRDFRSAGLVTWGHGEVVILDWDRLCAIAEWDPTYLRLHREPV